MDGNSRPFRSQSSLVFLTENSTGVSFSGGSGGSGELAQTTKLS